MQLVYSTAPDDWVTGHVLGSLISLQRCNRYILQPQLIGLVYSEKTVLKSLPWLPSDDGHLPGQCRCLLLPMSKEVRLYIHILELLHQWRYEWKFLWVEVLLVDSSSPVCLWRHGHFQNLFLQGFENHFSHHSSKYIDVLSLGQIIYFFQHNINEVIFSSDFSSPHIHVNVSEYKDHPSCIKRKKKRKKLHRISVTPHHWQSLSSWFFMHFYSKILLVRILFYQKCFF